MSSDDLAGEVQAWVDANWDTSITVREWWLRLAEAGYAYPSWPVGLGGTGWSRRDAMTLAAVLARNEVIGPPVGVMAATLAASHLNLFMTRTPQGNSGKRCRWAGTEPSWRRATSRSRASIQRVLKTKPAPHHRHALHSALA